MKRACTKPCLNGKSQMWLREQSLDHRENHHPCTSGTGKVDMSEQHPMERPEVRPAPSKAPSTRQEARQRRSRSARQPARWVCGGSRPIPRKPDKNTKATITVAAKINEVP